MQSEVGEIDRCVLLIYIYIYIYLDVYKSMYVKIYYMDKYNICI